MNMKKVMAPVLAAAMVAACAAPASAEEETIKLTVWGAEEDQTLLKTLTDNF